MKPASVPSPEAETQKVIVRRFPSVTVVDDNKGDWRSISLVSHSSVNKQRTATPMPTNSVRASTASLLLRTQGVEKAELAELRRLLGSVV